MKQTFTNIEFRYIYSNTFLWLLFSERRGGAYGVITQQHCWRR